MRRLLHELRARLLLHQDLPVLFPMVAASGHVRDTRDRIARLRRAIDEVADPLFDRRVHTHGVRFRQVLHARNAGKPVGPLLDLNHLAVVAGRHHRRVFGDMRRRAAESQGDLLVLAHGFDALMHRRWFRLSPGHADCDETRAE